MQVNERFSELPAYPFSRLRAHLGGVEPGGQGLDMSIGDPRHAPPGFIAAVLLETVDAFGRYPPNAGTPELLAAISRWLDFRYGVTVDPETRVLALNGSREGLFGACLALCPQSQKGRRPIVAMPNPFYQVYAGAAAAAGADPALVPAAEDTGFLPDFGNLGREILDRTAIAYICSPSNPQGTVASLDHMAELLRLAETHDFRVFADECYSELYRGNPPPGILECAEQVGANPERVVAFNSLSKRSNLPGLRSGFVAGGPKTIGHLRKLRAYGGAPLPLPIQRVSERVWADEDHVVASRAEYVRKYELADSVFSGLGPQVYRSPEAGLFLWIRAGDGERAVLTLWRRAGIRALPGAYLAGPVGPGEPDPAGPYVRLSLTPPRESLATAFRAIRNTLFAGH